jgi:hypothetical protein
VVGVKAGNFAQSQGVRFASGADGQKVLRTRISFDFRGGEGAIEG